jgi:UDP-N-acetylmuramate-alanine ligase
MNKKEILEKLERIIGDIDTMIHYAENENLAKHYAKNKVSSFYDDWADLPNELNEVIKSLKEDFGDMRMLDFSKME